MTLSRGVMGSVLGGAAGAGLWIGLFAATGYSVGILSVIVGGLAGFGMGMGTGGRGGVAPGVLAAAVTLVAILGARFGVAHLNTQKRLAEAMVITEEDATDALAWQIYEQWSAEEREMSEPDEEDGLPPEVIAAAERRWRYMGELEREDFVAGLVARQREDAEAAAPILTGLTLVFGFGISGLVITGLSMSCAYKIGSTPATKKEKAEEGGITVEATEPASGRFGAFSHLGQERPETPTVFRPAAGKADKAA